MLWPVRVTSCLMVHNSRCLMPAEHLKSLRRTRSFSTPSHRNTLLSGEESLTMRAGGVKLRLSFARVLDAVYVFFLSLGCRAPATAPWRENALPCNSYARSSGHASSGEALEVPRRRFASSSDGRRPSSTESRPRGRGRQARLHRPLRYPGESRLLN